MKIRDHRHAYYNKARNKWSVRFRVNGKEKRIGNAYVSQADAIDARNRAYIEYGVTFKSDRYSRQLTKCAEPSCSTNTSGQYCARHKVIKKKIEGYGGYRRICWLTKVCKKCGVDTPLSGFYGVRKTYDGRGTVCIKCNAQGISFQDRRILKEKEAEGDCIKTCTACHKDLKATNFKLEKGVGRVGRRSRCKKCDNVAERLARASLSEDQREELRSRERVCRYANPSAYRARKEKRYKRMKETSDGSITRSGIKSLLSTAKECSYCNRPLRTEASKTIDHIVPLSRLGQHVLSNLVVACKQCNLSKGAKPLHEWEPIQLYG